MPVSENFRIAANSQETDKVFLTLLTIDHADLAEPIRATSDTVDTVSRGNTFVAFHFELNLPTSSDGQIPSTKLSISNVDRRIVEAIRKMSPGSDPASVLIEVVMADDPDTIEMDLDGFSLTNVTYDRKKCEGNVTLENFYQEPWPKDTFNPNTAEGMFR